MHQDVRPAEYKPSLKSVLEQVRVRHLPELEDDDQGPFLHPLDATQFEAAVLRWIGDIRPVR